MEFKTPKKERAFEKCTKNTPTSSSQQNSLSKLELRSLTKDHQKWSTDSFEECDDSEDNQSVESFFEDHVDQEIDLPRPDEDANRESSAGNSSKNSTTTATSFCSHRNFWNVDILMKKSCFDAESGKLLSKELCQRNLNAMLKSKKRIDFYNVLQGVTTKPIRELSFAIFMLDKMSSRNVKDPVAKADQVIPFDIEAAKKADHEEFLPGGRRVWISSLITPSMCSSWVGSKAINKSIVSIVDEIRKRDDYFLIYSSPDSSNPTVYPSLSNDFFDNFGNVLNHGFSTSDNVSMVAIIRRGVRNFIDKKRREHKELAKQLLEKFNVLSAENKYFRTSDEPLQNMVANIFDKKVKATSTEVSSGEILEEIEIPENAAEKTRFVGKQKRAHRTGFEPSIEPSRKKSVRGNGMKTVQTPERTDVKVKAPTRKTKRQ